MKSATCLLPNKRPVSSSNWSGWGTRCIPPSWRLTFPFPNGETFFRTAPWQQPFLTAWSTIPEYSRSPETHIAWKTTSWNASSVPRKKHRTILRDRPVKKDSPPLFFGRSRWKATSSYRWKTTFFKPVKNNIFEPVLTAEPDCPEEMIFTLLCSGVRSAYRSRAATPMGEGMIANSGLEN